MSKWNKISLLKFQQIDKYSNDKTLSDIDKSLFSTCVVFDYTEFELDNLPIKKASKLVSKVNKIFSTPFNPKPFKRIGKYFVNYDVASMRLGQYIELSFFLAQPVQHAHLIMASSTNLPLLKNTSSTHRKKADYFLKCPVEKILGTVSKIIGKFSDFNKQYQDLFGIDPEVSGNVQQDPFNKNHGWTFSATRIADHLRIPLNDAFNLTAREAMNCLIYLKALAKYESEQLKHAR